MTEMEVARKTVQVEHCVFRCEKPFEAVHKTLSSTLPHLDPHVADILRRDDAEAIAEARRNGPKLWLFESRDHGALIAAEGRVAKAIQYEIGNPLTAERMTRRRIAAALYAPLRVVLYEDESGRAVFEYDRPSSLFGQFNDPEVAAVGVELDEELESVLNAAAR